jgi:hypothetical protein
MKKYIILLFLGITGTANAQIICLDVPLETFARQMLI